MQVDKGALLKAVKKVMPGVETGKIILEGSDSIILSNNGLHSFNTGISVSVPFEFEGDITGTVDATDLYNILTNKRLKVISDAIELEVIEGGIKFTGNGWESVLDFREDSAWMQEKINLLSSADCEKELPTDFMKGLNLCSIKGNPSDYHGIYVVGSSMYSTDQKLANIYDMDSECQEIWIGQKEINEFLKCPGIFVNYGLTINPMGHWIHFKDTEGTVFSMALKDTSLYKPALKFLKNQEDIEPVDTRLQGTLPKGFADAIETCAMMAEKNSKTGNKGVDILITAKKMTVKGIKAGGKMTNNLEWEEGSEPAIGNEKFKYRFVSNTIVTASRKAKDFFINPMKEESGGGCILVMYSEEFKTIILSMVSK